MDSCFSSIFSKTDVLEISFWDKTVIKMLVIMNIVAIIPVVLDKKLLADLDDIKLS